MLEFLIFACSAILAGCFVLFLFLSLVGWYDSDEKLKHKDRMENDIDYRMQYNSKTKAGKEKEQRKTGSKHS